VTRDYTKDLTKVTSSEGDFASANADVARFNSEVIESLQHSRDKLTRPGRMNNVGASCIHLPDFNGYSRLAILSIKDSVPDNVISRKVVEFLNLPIEPIASFSIGNIRVNGLVRTEWFFDNLRTLEPALEFYVTAENDVSFDIFLGYRDAARSDLAPSFLDRFKATLGELYSNLR
jgi:hypothetical protein